MPKRPPPSLPACGPWVARVWGLLLISSACAAKVADCPPLASGGTVYSSHRNHVQAVNQATGQLLWRTVLFADRVLPDFDPMLEEDVQWNLACLQEVRADRLVVSDRQGRTFQLCKDKGTLIAAKDRCKP